MQKQISSLVLIFYLFKILNLFSLNRDYKFECDEESNFKEYYKSYCLKHAPHGYPNWIPLELTKYIPRKLEKCFLCTKPSIYLGYHDPDFIKYKSHFLRQLEYCHQNRKCDCYWPECSLMAAEISNTTYRLFKDLIQTTDFSKLLNNQDLQNEFVMNPGWFLNEHGLTISFIAHQFRYSDYYHLCKDLEKFAAIKFDRKSIAQIKDKIEDILDELYNPFLLLYKNCYEKHPHEDIKKEIQFLKILAEDLSIFEDEYIFTNTSCKMLDDHTSLEICNFHSDNSTNTSNGKILNEQEICAINKLPKKMPITKSNDKLFLISSPQQSDILLEQGTLLNNLMLHKKAILVLEQSIRLNKFNLEAYIEKALAHFETNQIDLALQDYETIKLLSPISSPVNLTVGLRAIYIPKDKKAFAKGLITGTRTGLMDMAKEFFPSMFDCCRGILHGLWTLISSPEVSQEMIDAAYAIGEFVSQNSALECMECLIPELRDLHLTWEKIEDYSKGEKIGYIIGKYGADVIVPSLAIKGIIKLKALKRANTVLTLEKCSLSEINRKHILKISADFAARRETEINQAINAGRVIIRNANTKIHIMQPKHAWEKIIKISGNTEDDFKNVIKLLEENNIFSEKYRKSTIVRQDFIRFDHQMQINGHEVKAVFNQVSSNSETFLNNAWVITE